MSTLALETYRANWNHPCSARSLDSISSRRLEGYGADLWWLSPPCQPYTQRGLQRDVDDPRARSLLTLIEHIGTIRPAYVALENVIGFAGSRARYLLTNCLSANGYRDIREFTLCPTQLGVPNRRPRYYLVAGQEQLQPPPALPSPTPHSELRPYLDQESDADPELVVANDIVNQYEGALHVLDRDQPSAVSNCFTSAYGRSPVRSGSFLRIPRVDAADVDRIRRFSPAEILGLLHFPESFRFPGTVTLRTAWRLAGNSLSVQSVRHVLATIPELASELLEEPRFDTERSSASSGAPRGPRISRRVPGSEAPGPDRSCRGAPTSDDSLRR